MKPFQTSNPMCQVESPRTRGRGEHSPCGEEASPKSAISSAAIVGPPPYTTPLDSPSHDSSSRFGDILEGRPLTSNPEHLPRPPLGLIEADLLRLPGSLLYPVPTRLAQPRLESAPAQASGHAEELPRAARHDADQSGWAPAAQADTSKARPWPELSLSHAADLASSPAHAEAPAFNRGRLGLSVVSSNGKQAEQDLGASASLRQHLSAATSSSSSDVPGEERGGALCTSSAAMPGPNVDESAADALTPLDSDLSSAQYPAADDPGAMLLNNLQTSARRGDESVRGHLSNPFFGNARPGSAGLPETQCARSASAALAGWRPDSAPAETSMRSIPSAPIRAGRSVARQSSMRRGDESVRGQLSNPFFGASRPSAVAEDSAAGGAPAASVTGEALSSIFQGYARLATEETEGYVPLATPFESNDVQMQSLSFGSSLQRMRDALPNPFAGGASFGTDEGSGSCPHRQASSSSSAASNLRPGDLAADAEPSASASTFAGHASLIGSVPSMPSFLSNGQEHLSEARASAADTILATRTSHMSPVCEARLPSSGLLSSGSIDGRMQEAPLPKRHRAGEPDAGPVIVPLRLEVTTGPLAGQSYTAKEGELEVLNSSTCNPSTYISYSSY